MHIKLVLMAKYQIS